MTRRTVFDMLPKDEILTQLAEECVEAGQAALKLRGEENRVNPTPVSDEDALLNLVEELADVYLCAFVLFGGELDEKDPDNQMDALKDAICGVMEEKLERWKQRLGAREVEKRG